MMVAVIVALIGGSDGNNRTDDSVSDGQLLTCLSPPVCGPVVVAHPASVLQASAKQGEAISDGRGDREGAVYPTEGDWRDLICSYPWPCEEALAVVYGTYNCPNGESGGDAAAYNAGNYGLYQVSCTSHAWRVGGDCSRLFDPATNIQVAYDIYADNGGWSPWACRP